MQLTIKKEFKTQFKELNSKMHEMLTKITANPQVLSL